MVWWADESCWPTCSSWVEYLTLNDSDSLATSDEFKKAFLERFDKTQSVLEAQRLISNLRQSSDEDFQDFFDRVSTCVICQQVESNLSSCKDNQELLKCALTAEISLSNPASRSLSEIAEINNLRQELAAMRLVLRRVAVLSVTGLRIELGSVLVIEAPFLLHHGLQPLLRSCLLYTSPSPRD